MTLLALAGLAGAMFILAVIPGPGVFATVSRALASGFPHAAVLICGIVLGDLLFLLAAIYGLALVADLLGGFFLAVKICGGLYLVWLGVRMWSTENYGSDFDNNLIKTWKSDFLCGLVITLGNPKVILFYLGFLPTFIDLHTLTASSVVAVVLIVSTVLGGVMLGYALAAAGAGKLLKNPRALKWLHRTSGGMMMGVGATLVLKSP